jgi:Ca-activated chloride channel family protein
MDALTLHFIRPVWLFALPLAVLLPWAWQRLRRPSGDWARVCDPHLLRWLSVGQADSRPGKRGSWWTGLLLAAGALALAGPSWEKLPDTSYSAMDARVLVLDLSASMLAEDLKPNRLTQVRYRLSDMLQQTREGQLGLVAYAGDAYAVSPLTSDMNTIANMLPALQPDIMPVAGSRADRALEMAAELLERAGNARGDILLITDSASAADVETAARLARRGVRTSVLAVGTPDGAPIPSGSGFVSDDSGAVVIVRLRAEILSQLAAAGGGRLSVLSQGLQSSTPWPDADGSEFARRDDALGERWKDAGPWLVLLLLPFMAAGFRRGLLFSMSAALVPILLTSQPAQAGFWDDLWKRRDQQAQEALQEADPETAALLAQNPEIAGEAWFRVNEFERANDAWTGSQSADAHYNRGNALAHAGDLAGALAAYDSALALDPEMEDALFNRALVEQMQQQQQQDQQNQDSSEGEQGDPSDEQGESEPQEGEQGEGEENESEQQQDQGGEQSQRAEQELAAAWSEEDAQAMEQWLRRIPDDPGGLLRRKFRSQHQRRGAPADEEDSW